MKVAPKNLPFKRQHFSEVFSLKELSGQEKIAFSWHKTKPYLRAKLWDETNATCALCGHKILHPKNASLDHIVPKAAGGRTRERNVRLAHKKCNSARNHKPEVYSGRLLEIAYKPMVKHTPK